MLVTPTRKPFRKHKPGESFELADKAAKVLILAGILTPASVDGGAVEISARTGLPKRQYRRRDLRAES